MNKIDKQIFKALEEEIKPNRLGGLIGGFITIAVGVTMLNEIKKSLKGGITK